MKINYKHGILSLLILLICSFQFLAHAQNKKPAPKLGKSSLKQVIAAMTVEEKSKLVVGMGFKMPGMPRPKKGQSTDIGGFKLPPSDPQAYDIPEKLQARPAELMPYPGWAFRRSLFLTALPVSGSILNDQTTPVLIMLRLSRWQHCWPRPGTLL